MALTPDAFRSGNDASTRPALFARVSARTMQCMRHLIVSARFPMNIVLPALAASAIALGSPPQPALQHTCPARVPTTAEAARSAELLKRAALAVCELANSRNEQIA